MVFELSKREMVKKNGEEREWQKKDTAGRGGTGQILSPVYID